MDTYDNTKLLDFENYKEEIEGKKDNAKLDYIREHYERMERMKHQELLATIRHLEHKTRTTSRMYHGSLTMNLIFIVLIIIFQMLMIRTNDRYKILLNRYEDLSAQYEVINDTNQKISDKLDEFMDIIES